MGRGLCLCILRVLNNAKQEHSEVLRFPWCICTCNWYKWIGRRRYDGTQKKKKKEKRNLGLDLNLACWLGTWYIIHETRLILQAKRFGLASTCKMKTPLQWILGRSVTHSSTKSLRLSMTWVRFSIKALISLAEWKVHSSSINGLSWWGSREVTGYHVKWGCTLNGTPVHLEAPCAHSFTPKGRCTYALVWGRNQRTWKKPL